MNIDMEKLNNVRAKYRAEKLKREQNTLSDYSSRLSESDKFIQLWGDPNADLDYSREPVSKQVDAVIIGGGIGGLGMAVRLREIGLSELCIVEKGADFGGTWYWNNYPGAQCDIDASIYLPFLEEMNYVPKNKYAHVSEISEHLRAIAKKYDLYEGALLQTVVEQLIWSEEELMWSAHTDRGYVVKAKYAISCTSVMDTPKIPNIPGVSDFKGAKFHTSRWDYDFTGGDSHGNLHNLNDKKVAVVGTGCTALQCVPHVAEAAEHLYVVQRTPSTVSERGNHPIDPDWDVAKKPGWQKERMANFAAMTVGSPVDEDLIGDKWTHIFRNVVSFISSKSFEGASPEEMAASAEMADFEMMEEIRERVDIVVEDKDVAESLKPYYRVFCKRPGFSDNYLPVFNRDNVTLLDTDGQGIEKFTETGIVVQGQEYQIDGVVFATGFDVSGSAFKQSGLDIIGRDGLHLAAKWQEQITTMHGYCTHGFPNLFFIGSSQTGVIPNFWHMAEEQTAHVAHVVKRCESEDVAAVEPTRQAELEWLAELQAHSGSSAAFYADCTPSYFNNEGDTQRVNHLLDGNYGGGAEKFFGMLQSWRDDGTMPGMILIK